MFHVQGLLCHFCMRSPRRGAGLGPHTRARAHTHSGTQDQKASRTESQQMWERGTHSPLLPEGPSHSRAQAVPSTGTCHKATAPGSQKDRPFLTLGGPAAGRVLCPPTAFQAWVARPHPRVQVELPWHLPETQEL